MKVIPEWVVGTNVKPFWNQLHQVRSKSKDWKTKYISAHDAILESPASGTLKVERLENQIH
jgi:hypothetical protein